MKIELYEDEIKEMIKLDHVAKMISSIPIKLIKFGDLEYIYSTYNINHQKSRNLISSEPISLISSELIKSCNSKYRGVINNINQTKILGYWTTRYVYSEVKFDVISLELNYDHNERLLEELIFYNIIRYSLVIDISNIIISYLQLNKSTVAINILLTYKELDNLLILINKYANLELLNYHVCMNEVYIIFIKDNITLELLATLFPINNYLKTKIIENISSLISSSSHYDLMNFVKHLYIFNEIDILQEILINEISHKNYKLLIYIKMIIYNSTIFHNYGDYVVQIKDINLNNYANFENYIVQAKNIDQYMIYIKATLQTALNINDENMLKYFIEWWNKNEGYPTYDIRYKYFLDEINMILTDDYRIKRLSIY